MTIRQAAERIQRQALRDSSVTDVLDILADYITYDDPAEEIPECVYSATLADAMLAARSYSPARS